MNITTSVLIVAVIFQLSLLTSTTAQLSNKKFKKLQKEAKKEFKKTKNRGLLPRLVQLAFHDCIGGCDGCLDPTVPNNSNLGPAITLVQDFRADNVPELSQADVNVFIATEALKLTVKNAKGNVRIPFSIGRTDCDSSNGFPVRVFAAGQSTDSLQFLQNNFNLTPEEAVALIGVHSLGRLHANVSGFDGPWDQTQLALDNRYYTNMRRPGWTIENINVFFSTSQWSRDAANGKDMTAMLHADMILFRNFTTSGEFDTPNCTFVECPRSNTADIVDEFANKQKKFHKALEKAFQKMVGEVDNSGLTRIG